MNEDFDIYYTCVSHMMAAKIMREMAFTPHA